ncbi:MAG: response regulator [Proteobacteria bacterium]|nr:response regulator [Pseudomonadota bacterium]
MSAPPLAGSDAGAVRHVGIVDDDPAVRDSLHFLLDVSGYPAATYESAADFEARRDRAGLAGLILDHHMPLVTGLELVARLRAAGDALPVLLITGSPSPTIAAQAAALGVVRTVEKPPAADELLGFVASILG